MSTLHKGESESTVNNVNERCIQLVRVVTYFEVEIGAHDTHERNSKLQPAPPHARTPVLYSTVQLLSMTMLHFRST